MDFKSLLNKLDSMQAPVPGVAAPQLPKAVQLDESAQLRVLSGQSTILAESALMEKADKKEVSAEDKKKKEEQKKKIAKIVDEASAKKMKKKDEEIEESWDDMVNDLEQEVAEGFPTVADAKARAEKEKTTGKFDKKQTSTGTQYTRKSGTFDDGGKDKDQKKAEKKSKDTNEGIADVAKKVGNAVKQAGSKVLDKLGHGSDEEMIKDLQKKTGMPQTGKKPMAVQNEGAKPDFLDIDGDGDKKEPMKKAAADKKKGAAPKKGVNPFAKKAVKESVEGTLTFAKALQIIKESNGTAQIDPLDDNLWAWARRVAASKFNESVKADVYAATTYERMGGTWGIAQING